MNNFRVIIVLLVAMVMLSPLAGVANQEQEPLKQDKETKVSLAVLDFIAEVGVQESEGRLLTQKFASSLQKTNQYEIMTRTETNRLMTEQNFKLTDAVLDPANAAACGRLLKVGRIITGQLGKVGSTYVVIVHVVDVESGKELKTLDRSHRGEVDQLLDVMNELALEIAKMAPPTQDKKEQETELVSVTAEAITGSDMAAFVKGEKIEGNGPFYTKCNIWYEKPESIACINYQVGAIIPAGTKVSDVVLLSGRRGRTSLSFKRVNDGMTFTIAFTPNYHPGVTITNFRDRLFSRKQLSFWTSGMSQGELDAIKVGAHRPGMSKKAVLIAYGFPPEHQTPTLLTSRWQYWVNRFRTKAVLFSSDGKTTN